MIQLNAMANGALMACALLAGAARAGEAPLREYRGLALSGGGQRIAALESLDPGDLPGRPHAVVVVRDARGGAI
ncbi:MAG TPA: hypothetical protein DCW29_01630, partial [Janthinobacterium sp.]|nr:hypothetical protein [Janthinobacterium sp.]